MSAILSLLYHLSSSLDNFVKAIPDAFQLRDPKLLHPPIQALVIIEHLHETLLHELKAPNCYTFLSVLTPHFRNILFTLNDALGYCFLGGPEPIYISLEEYQQRIHTMVEVLKGSMKTHLDSILKKMHEEAEKEHGQPMCFAIGAYRPWDTPPPPESELMKLLRKSLDSKAEPCIALKMSPRPPLTSRPPPPPPPLNLPSCLVSFDEKSLPLGEQSPSLYMPPSPECLGQSTVVSDMDAVD